MYRVKHNLVWSIHRGYSGHRLGMSFIIRVINVSDKAVTTEDLCSKELVEIYLGDQGSLLLKGLHSINYRDIVFRIDY